MLYFRHLRIALRSAEALRGVSTNYQRLSLNQALHLSSMKAEHQTHRCCAVSYSSPQNQPSAESCLSDQRAPAAEGRVVASPEERDLHSFLSFSDVRHSRDISLHHGSPPPLHVLRCVAMFVANFICLHSGHLPHLDLYTQALGSSSSSASPGRTAPRTPPSPSLAVHALLCLAMLFLL